MVKTSNKDEAPVGQRGTLSGALNYVDKEFGAWFVLGGKFAAVFGAWLAVMLLGRRFVTSPELLGLIAIGYWFAWMFAVGLLGVGVVVGVTGLLDKFNRSDRQSKY